MIIDCISDLHGHFPVLEGGDLLIVAGDLTASHTTSEQLECLSWIQQQKYAKKILISGNHDSFFESCKPGCFDNWKITYLCDSGTEFEYWEDIPHPASTPYVSIDCLMKEKRVLKIWGSPWSLTFPNINPRCMAFTGTEADLKAKFDLIPDDIDILITHCPPYGIMDEIKRPSGRCDIDSNGGSVSLCKTLVRIKPKLHVFGHIHEGHGKRTAINHQWIINFSPDTTYINASHVNEHYEPVNKSIRIIL